MNEKLCLFEIFMVVICHSSVLHSVKVQMSLFFIYLSCLLAVIPNKFYAKSVFQCTDSPTNVEQHIEVESLFLSEMMNLLVKKTLILINTAMLLFCTKCTTFSASTICRKISTDLK